MSSSNPQRRTYRNRKNGAVRIYPTALAAHFPDLVEVKADAKPLAYTAIPQAAVDAVKAASDSVQKEK